MQSLIRLPSMVLEILGGYLKTPSWTFKKSLDRIGLIFRKLLRFSFIAMVTVSQ